jgi:DNA-binding MarR family transcriptional regulator
MSCHCQSLRQAARRATALYDAAMAPYGLRISQYSILSRLRRYGPLSLQALAALLVLDRTTLGRNLRPLERDGLVASEAEAGDKRVRLLALTEEGRSVLQAAGPAWHAAQAAFEQQYGKSEASALQQALHRVTQALIVPERVAGED